MVQEEIEGRPEQMVISTMMLRSMQQAHYDDVNLGHFGLSSQIIRISTSPIRRYPHLTVQYGLIRKYLIEKSMDNKEVKRWEDTLLKAG